MGHSCSACRGAFQRPPWQAPSRSKSHDVLHRYQTRTHPPHQTPLRAHAWRARSVAARSRTDNTSQGTAQLEPFESALPAGPAISRLVGCPKAKCQPPKVRSEMKEAKEPGLTTKLPFGDLVLCLAKPLSWKRLLETKAAVSCCDIFIES